MRHVQGIQCHLNAMTLFRLPGDLNLNVSALSRNKHIALCTSLGCLVGKESSLIFVRELTILGLVER